MKPVALTTLLLAFAASSAHALEARVTKDTPASAASAWAAVGDFCHIAVWHPAVAKCDLSSKDGDTLRTLTLKDGAQLVEKQVAIDGNTMSLTYTIVGGPLPIANYASTLKVVARPQGATFDWSGTFDAKGVPDADAVKIITGIYAAGLDALVQQTSK